MKKVLLLSFLTLFLFTSTAGAKAKVEKTQKTQIQKVETERVTSAKAKKDVLKNDEYKALKRKYFDAEGYGDTYNCKVEQQRFCKVKDLDSGVYVLCDRDVSRTQWESAKIFYKYGRCVKLN